MDEKDHKRFFACIGNPPYQDDTANTGSTSFSYAPPLYHYMIDAGSQIADRVEMITPARFLFNAGSTPKAWNEKMLNDEHFKVMEYNQDSSNVFPGTNIAGGVAVTYRDQTKKYGPVRVFTPFEELTSTLKKVTSHAGFTTLRTTLNMSNKYDLDALYESFPETKDIISGSNKDRRFKSNAFVQLPFVFTEVQQSKSALKVIGLINGKRVWRYIDMELVDKNNSAIGKWKVIVPKTNGCGVFGEALVSPLVSGPLTGYTHTFISIGRFDTEDEAQNCLKYIKTKFVRAMLGVLKVTQDTTPRKWEYVPIQGFTSSSDIDWSQSIDNIDQQLYTKYGLSDEEIAFIEKHVKAME